ncbi:MAG: hypothetical protein LBC70_09595, partial [Chitinispirillales bacterium]|nr:hypothetical protein [Chitinispirillales bacterium]
TVANPGSACCAEQPNFNGCQASNPCTGLTTAPPGSACCQHTPTFNGCQVSNPCAGLTTAPPGSACCQHTPTFNGCQGSSDYPGPNVMSCHWELQDPGGGCYPILTEEDWGWCQNKVPHSVCEAIGCTIDPINAQYTTWINGMGCTWTETGNCSNIDSQTAFEDCRCYGQVMPTGCPDAPINFTPVERPIPADWGAFPGAVFCDHPSLGALSCQWTNPAGGSDCYSINNGWHQPSQDKPCSVLVQECIRDGQEGTAKLFHSAVQNAANNEGGGHTCASISGQPVSY